MANACYECGAPVTEAMTRADAEALCRHLTPHLERWPDLTIVHRDTRIPIAGNGYASIGRLELLGLLDSYVERLGVELRFETEVASLAELGGADLVVGADGAFSSLRTANEERFRTTTEWHGVAVASALALFAVDEWTRRAAGRRGARFT